MNLHPARFVFVVFLALILSSPITAQTAAQRQRAAALAQQAQGLAGQKRLPEAIQAMKEAVTLVPKSDVYLSTLAQLEAQAGSYADSLQHALDAAKLNPRQTGHQVLVMSVAYEAQDYDKAMEYARKVVALGQAKVGPATDDQAKTILRLAPGKKTDKLVVDASQLHLKGKDTEALALLKESIQLDKDEVVAGFLAEVESLASYDRIDQHALKATAAVEGSVADLAKYLTGPAKTDAEKVRAIFRWVADRIAYNVEDFLANRPTDESVATVLKTRKAVCAGYANLVEALGKEAGLEVVKISGSAKGLGSGAVGHAWNAFKLDGNWKLVDATWCAGTVDQNARAYKKGFREFYYFTTPEQFVFTHLPRDPQWQLLTPPVTAAEFQGWSKVEPGLLAAGVPSASVRTLLTEKPDAGIVRAFSHPGGRVMIRKAPLERKLKPGKYEFRIEAIGFTDLSIFTGGKSEPLSRKGYVFEGTLQLREAGPVKLMGKLPGNKSTSYGIFEYVVE